MAVESPPSFLQASTYGAEQTRRTIASLLQRGASIGSVLGGLVGATDCQITAGSGLNVEVSAGELWVPGSSASTQSGYYCRVSSASTLSIAAANESNPRIDRISAIVKDAAYTGSENTFSVAVETGTPTSGATLVNLSGVAAAPTSSLTLGYLLVPAKAVSLENKNISNSAGLLVPGMQGATYREGTAANRPAAGVKGRLYRATDTGESSVDTGSAWITLIPGAPKYGVTAEAVSGTAFLIAEGHRVHVTVTCSAVLTEVNVGGVQLSTEGSPHSTSFVIYVGQEFTVRTTGAVNYKYNLIQI